MIHIVTIHLWHLNFLKCFRNLARSSSTRLPLRWERIEKKHIPPMETEKIIIFKRQPFTRGYVSRVELSFTAAYYSPCETFHAVVSRCNMVMKRIHSLHTLQKCQSFWIIWRDCSSCSQLFRPHWKNRDSESLCRSSQYTYRNKIYSTLPETNIAPENWWLEDEISFWRRNFSGVNSLLVSGSVSVCSQKRTPFPW